MDTPADKTARQLMDTAHHGNDISVQYNNLPISEQQEVFASMRNLKTHGDFPDLQITGSKDGTLADMQREKGTLERMGSLFLGDKTQDVYDTPQDAQKKFQDAQESLGRFIGAGGIGNGTAKGAADALTNRRQKIAEALNE